MTAPPELELGGRRTRPSPLTNQRRILILTDRSTTIYSRYGTPKRIRPRSSLEEGYGRVLATGLRSHIDGRLDPRDWHRSPEHVRHVRRQASALPRSPAPLRGQHRGRVVQATLRGSVTFRGGL